MRDPQPPSSLPAYLADGIPKQDIDTLADIRQYVSELIEARNRPVDSTELPDRAEPVGAADDARGTVVKERVACGDETCRCESGNPSDMHGPYLYLYYRDQGQLRSEYLGKPADCGDD